MALIFKEPNLGTALVTATVGGAIVTVVQVGVALSQGAPLTDAVAAGLVSAVVTLGAAAAAGYGPLHLGTDIGGSVRLPGSWCGLVARGRAAAGSSAVSASSSACQNLSVWAMTKIWRPSRVV